MKKIDFVIPLFASPSALPEDKPLKDIFQRVILVNLDKRKDRLEHFTRELNKGWPFLDPLRFQAVWGDKCGWPKTWNHGGNTWGCMQSHRQILERCLLDDINSVLVLEDDLILADNFTKKVSEFFRNVPSNWDCCMIGGQHNVPATDIGNGIVKCNSVGRTHCYGIRGKMLKDLYIHWISTEGHCDHRFAEIMNRYNVYAPNPFLAGQMQDQSDISGARNPTKFWADPDFEKHKVIFLKAPKEALPKLRENGFHTGFSRDGNTDIDVGLRDIFNGTPTKQKLKDFIIMLMWEVESMNLAGSKTYVTIWHPSATLEMIKDASPSKVIEITGNTADECLRMFRQNNSKSFSGWV